MGIEDDFYATIKFKNGEEIFCRVAASEEEDKTMLIVISPVMICEIKTKYGVSGYKVEPWIKTSTEDMFIIDIDNVLTISESIDDEMIEIYQNFLSKSERSKTNKTKLNRKMGYLANVKEAKISLENIFKNS